MVTEGLKGKEGELLGHRSGDVLPLAAAHLEEVVADVGAALGCRAARPVPVLDGADDWEGLDNWLHHWQGVDGHRIDDWLGKGHCWKATATSRAATSTATSKARVATVTSKARGLLRQLGLD